MEYKGCPVWFKVHGVIREPKPPKTEILALVYKAGLLTEFSGFNYSVCRVYRVQHSPPSLCLHGQWFMVGLGFEVLGFRAWVSLCLPWLLVGSGSASPSLLVGLGIVFRVFTLPPRRSWCV